MKTFFSASAPHAARTGIERRTASLRTVPVTDPFGIANDAQMHFLAAAFDPQEVENQIERYCPLLTGEEGRVRLRAIRATRYKPGRRCVIEYDMEVERPSAPAEALTIVGKSRARNPDQSTYLLLRSLWHAGFGINSADKISVPEPLGVLPDLHMALARKSPGTAATTLITGANGLALARRIAEAIYKLHSAGIPPKRRHSMADELGILHQRLEIVAHTRPALAKRVSRLLDACDRVGASTPEPASRGIHRDFYPDQVLVDGDRLYLLDFDLYCEGDPGLDVGNFIGHLTEQSVRTLGDPSGLLDREEALERR